MKIQQIIDALGQLMTYAEVTSATMTLPGTLTPPDRPALTPRPAAPRRFCALRF